MKELGTCRTVGCTTLADIQGFCPRCYSRLQKLKQPKRADAEHHITSEQVAEVRRRSARFQSNTRIATEMGLSPKQVRRALRSKAAS
jgi:hypothetical protein